MSLLAELSPKKGSVNKKKRLGRGIGSGLGGTSAKGHKGQLARTGGRVRRGFEGGQMPLWRRIPKFGFTNPNRKSYELLNLSDLNRFDGEVTAESLIQAGVLKKGSMLKVLGNGTLDKALTVKAHKFSAKAKEAIEKAGGKAEVIEN